MMNAPPFTRPAHIPSELVYDDFPLILGHHTTEDPFADMIPSIHRRYPPVFYSTNVYPGGTPGWVVRRMEDLKAIYLDTEHFSNKDFAPFAKMVGETWSQVPAETDPPMHGLYRTLVNPLFSPKALSKLDTYVRDTAKRFIAAFKDRGECDFAKEFAVPFPVAVFLHIMGLPEEEMPKFLGWEHGLLHTPDMAEVAAAVRGVNGYLHEVAEDRRVNPRDDLMTFAVQAEIEGRKLNKDEITGFCFGLFIGGLDTVSTNIALQFRHLATHPADQRRLRAEPALRASAIEEMMRCYPSSTTFRTVVKPIEVNGVSFMPGDKVAMSTTLAGRDPEAYENADVVDFDRNAAHISFAYGPHRCLGVQLARREMAVALDEMFAAIPEFHLKEGALINTSLGGMVQPDSLPLLWTI